MRQFYAFTPDEDAKINSMRQDGARWVDIAAALNAPEWSVRNRATVANLPCLATPFRAAVVKTKRATHEWTEEQDAILFEHWGKIAPGDIGKLVGKSRQAVMSHAIVVKLRTRNPMTNPVRTKTTSSTDDTPRHVWNRDPMPANHEISMGALMATMDPAWIAAKLDG